MESVKVRRGDLIERIRRNRDEHRALFLKAQEGFRQRVVKELDEMLRDAREGGPVRTIVRLQQPEDHTKEYDRALDMLEMGTEAEVAVDAHTFATLVRNEWAWFDKARHVNTTYASGGKLGA